MKEKSQDLVPFGMPEGLVTIVDGKPVTTSLKVAEVFGKYHKNVLRRISKLLNNKHISCRLNFEPMIREVKTPQGGVRKETYYVMDSVGFANVALAFTGEKADVFRWVYTNQFEHMRTQLETDQRRELQEEYDRKYSECVIRHETLLEGYKMGFNACKPDFTKYGMTGRSGYPRIALTPAYYRRRYNEDMKRALQPMLPSMLEYMMGLTESMIEEGGNAQ